MYCSGPSSSSDSIASSSMYGFPSELDDPGRNRGSFFDLPFVFLDSSSSFRLVERSSAGGLGFAADGQQ